jgi:serine/threonine protein kinase
MSLLDEGFMNLAGPPSFESCTRDIYSPGQIFALGTAHGIALGVASVGAHLHARGLMLGDLYAHNILHHDDGRCRVTDFGGATFVPQGASGLKHALERLEVRAFGILLEELLDRCMADAANSESLVRMRTLQAQCQGIPVQRPLFANIQALLESIVP